MPTEPTPQSEEQFIRKVVKQFEEKLRRSLSVNKPQTLEEIEKEAGEIGAEVTRIVQDEKLRKAGSGFTGKFSVCPCGGLARFRGFFSRHVTTLHGKTAMERAYYYCSECKTGRYPLDTVLGVVEGGNSVGLRALLARLSCYMPSRVAAKEAQILRNINPSHTTIQRVSLKAGEQIKQDWKKAQADLWAERLPDPAHRVLQLHLTSDGVMVKVGKEWREAKLGIAYEKGKWGGVERIGYYATLACSSDFGKFWRTLAFQMGSGKCRELAVVADGAEWIWMEVGKYFPRSIQILDYYHAVEHLWVVARTRFGDGSKEASEWMDKQKGLLLENKVVDVIKDIASWEWTSESKAAICHRERAYLQKHAHRMQYATFREKGLHIGSGVAEAGCKATVQARMKGPGMRWEEKGAEAMLSLRSAWCSNQHTDFNDIVRRADLAA